jgi:hypothetical protein
VWFPNNRLQIVISGLFIFSHVPTLRKKQAIVRNKQVRKWKILKDWITMWVKNRQYSPISDNQNCHFLFKRDSMLGAVSFCLYVTQKIQTNLLQCNSVRSHGPISPPVNGIQPKSGWNYFFRMHENAAVLHFLLRNSVETYKTFLLKESFFLNRICVKAYRCPVYRRPLFLGRWGRAPNHITGMIGPSKIGQVITFESNLLIVRQGTSILLDKENFLPWEPGVTVSEATPLIARRGQVRQASDITLGIPQIEALLELRTQTGLSFRVISLYHRFRKKGRSNNRAARKSLHFCQRIVIDSVQRIYRINGVVVNDKHVELISRPIVFAQVIWDYLPDRLRVQRDLRPIEVVERINRVCRLETWQMYKTIHFNSPTILYKPVFLGLTKRALCSLSFLSSASFQETSRVLSVAAVSGHVDYLLGLKENLILGTRLPIGTTSRIFDIFFVPRFSHPTIAIKQQAANSKIPLIWFNVICYLEDTIMLDS